ncbi:MAG: hypothetical protein FJ134_03320 [Deltaproteobacteria bacterium]|nr:hypothetical protein [Deltaproteobacteria bacterium]
MKATLSPKFLRWFFFWVALWGVSPGGLEVLSSGRCHAMTIFSTVPAEQSPSDQDFRTTVNAGHSNPIGSIAWSRDGKFLATGGSDIRIWEADGGKLIKVLREETERVKLVSWSPDGKFLAAVSVASESTGEAIMVRLWDLKKGVAWKNIKAFQSPREHFKYDQIVSWSPDGRSLAYLAGANQIRILDVAADNDKPSHKVEGLEAEGAEITSLSWSPDGNVLATGSTKQFVYLWNLPTPRKSRVLQTPFTGGVRSLAWSPRGDLLAAAGKSLAVWEAASGKLTQVLGQDQGWGQVNWSPDGRFLMGNDGDIHLWEARGGVLFGVLKKFRFGYAEMTWSPDSQKIATCGEDIRLWEVADGRVKKVIDRYYPTTRQVQWSPDGRFILMAGLEELIVWEARAGRKAKHFDNLYSYVGSIHWNPDRKSVAWSSAYEEMAQTCIWDVEKNTLKKFRAIGPVWSPDGQKIAALFDDDGGYGVGRIRIWEAKNGKLILTLGESKSLISAYSWSPDGRFLAAACGKETIRIWDTKNGQLRRELIGDDNNVRYVVWTRDGRYLISGGSREFKGQEHTVRVWDITSGTLFKMLDGHKEQISSLSLSSDGKFLATGSDDGLVQIWETYGFTRHRSIKEKCSPSLYWSPDGRYLAARSGSASGCTAQGVRIWEISRGTLRVTLADGQGEKVRSVSWSPDGRHLVTGVEEGILSVWDVEAGKVLAQFYAFQDSSVSVIPEGFFNGSGHFDRRVHFVRDMEAFDFNRFYDAFYRPDLVEKKLQGEDISKEMRGLNLTEALQHPPPKVEILAPQEGQEVSAREVTVKVKVQDTGGQIGDIRLLHNGKLVESLGVYRLAREEGPAAVDLARAGEADHGIGRRGVALRRVTIDPKAVQSTPFQPQQGAVTKEYRVTLVSGENTLTACAFNGPNTVMSEMVSVRVACRAPARPPELYVLAVGLNTFAQAGLPHLKFAVKDARDLADLLGQAGKPLYHKIHLKVLLEEEATKANILQAAQEMGRQMWPEDVLVVNVATHGRADGYRYYLFTHAPPGADASQGVLTSPELMELSKACRALKQVWFLDTCQAGGIKGAMTPLYDGRVSVLAKSLGMHVLAGAGSEQAARDDYQGNGLFTHFLLKGLRGAADANQDGRIQVQELGAYLNRMVGEASRGDQVPFIRTFGEDLPLAQVAR